MKVEVVVEIDSEQADTFIMEVDDSFKDSSATMKSIIISGIVDREVKKRTRINWSIVDGT